jgi:hypothetical protein
MSDYRVLARLTIERASYLGVHLRRNSFHPPPLAAQGTLPHSNEAMVPAWLMS